MSVSTVSNVVNGRTDRMRVETLARVEAAAFLPVELSPLGDDVGVGGRQLNLEGNPHSVGEQGSNARFVVTNLDG